MIMSEDYTAYERKLAAMAQREAELRLLNKAVLFEALAAAGIDRVTVCFDGCGDSGQIESITAHGAEDAEIGLPEAAIELRTVRFEGAEVVIEQRSVADAIEIMSYAYLEGTHDGWEIGDGAYGVFTFAVAERTIGLEYNERYTATTISMHEF
jgi:hypothetical protein